jgi:hypothetical protein
LAASCSAYCNLQRSQAASDVGAACQGAECCEPIPGFTYGGGADSARGLRQGEAGVQEMGEVALDHCLPKPENACPCILTATSDGLDARGRLGPAAHPGCKACRTLVRSALQMAAGGHDGSDRMSCWYISGDLSEVHNPVECDLWIPHGPWPHKCVPTTKAIQDFAFEILCTLWRALGEYNTCMYSLIFVVLQGQLSWSSKW